MFVELSKYEALARGISESTWKMMKAFEKKEYVEKHPLSKYAERYEKENNESTDTTLPTTIKNPIKDKDEQYSVNELLNLPVLDGSVFDKLWENLEEQEDDSFSNNRDEYNKRLMNIVRKLSVSPKVNDENNMIEFNHTSSGCEIYLTNKNDPYNESYKIQVPMTYFEEKELGSRATISKFNNETYDWDKVVESKYGVNDIYDYFCGNDRELNLKCSSCGKKYTYKYKKGELKKEPNDQGIFSIDFESTGKKGKLKPNGKCLCLECHKTPAKDKVDNLIKKASLIQKGRAELSKIASKLKGLKILGDTFTYELKDRQNYTTLEVWDDDDDCIGGFTLSFKKDGIYYDGVSFNADNIDDDDYENIKIDNINDLLNSENFQDMLQDLQNAVEDRENARMRELENNEEVYIDEPESTDDENDFYVLDDDDEDIRDNYKSYL